MTTIVETMAARGWQKVPGDMRHKRLASIAPHGDAQFIKDETIISISNGSLCVYRGSVQYYATPGIVINAILVPPAKRGKGEASRAMADLIAAFREIASPSIDLYVEACQIGGVGPAGLSDAALVDWYLRQGFTLYGSGGNSCLMLHVAPGD